MSTLQRGQAPQPGRLRPFEFPAVTRDVLPSGLALLHARHGDLPLVTLSLVVDAGGTEESAEQAGLAHMTANALASGTATRSADDIAWAIESLGIHLEAQGGWDAASARMTVPTERLEEAAALFAEVVRRPAFPEREISRLREQQLAGILSRRKQPGTLAGDAVSRAVFAPEVPWSRPLVGSATTVEKLGRDDVAAFYQARYTPAAASLIVVGDIDRAAARALAERWFGDWTGPAAPRRDFSTARAVDSTTVFIVDRPGAVQSEIRIGDVGVERTTPDYFALAVMNTVLGGSFTSRLNMNLREKHGFTYGVRSGFTMRRKPGPFLVQTAVANDVTARAVDSTTVFIVDRPGAVQSEIRIGDVGVERTTPDYFALAVMNTVLGGSFTSRLNMNLREKHGFTYGVRSGFTMRRKPGPFLVQTAVANDVTARAVEEALREVERMRESGGTEEELSSARDYLGGVMPLQLQTTAQLAARIDDLVVYDLPLDWFRHYRSRIAAVTADDVVRVARAYLRPERLAIVVVGAADQIAPDLEKLGVGPVRTLELPE